MADASLNKYTRPTGEGYETRLSVSDSGTGLYLDWFDEDLEPGETVYACHAVERGTVQLVADRPDAPLEVLTVRDREGRPSTNISEVVRRTLDVPIGDDIRVYHLDDAICELVDPNNDPRVSDQ